MNSVTLAPGSRGKLACTRKDILCLANTREIAVLVNAEEECCTIASIP
jgi:hypothetical protein